MQRTAKFLVFILAIVLAIGLGGCTKETVDEKPIDKNEENQQNQGGEEVILEQLKMPEKGEEIAVITTNHGEIKIRLFPEVAPKAVENFKTHAQNGYYDGVTFHRVIKDFMIQGGDPEGTGRGGESIWGLPFEDEFDIYYHNFRGALSMANAGTNTNGSQFFIVQCPYIDNSLLNQMKQIGAEGGFPEAVIKKYEELGGTPWLDYRHTVFGQVFEGMEVVDKIANVETDDNDKPIEPVIMEKVEIVVYE